MKSGKAIGTGRPKTLQPVCLINAGKLKSLTGLKRLSMTSNEIIYHIKQNREFSVIWAQFTREEKEEVIRRLETKEPSEIEKVLLEIKIGQNRLF